MKASLKILITACLTCSFQGPTIAYERETHAAITNSAFQISQLNFPANGILLQQLGLDVETMLDTTGQPFGQQYVSIQGSASSPIFLPKTSFEVGIIHAGIHSDVTSLDIPFWLMCGVVREDDIVGEPPGKPGDPSSDANIDGTFSRPFNHFYDPVHNIPLTVLGFVTPGVKAPDWATGAKDSIGKPNVLDPNTKNHYTVFDVREAMFRALTQQTQNAGIIQDLVNENTAQEYDEGFLSSLESTRGAYWATTFRALGDVLHLNQDMAQPQHTRNEAHNGEFGPLVRTLLTGHESVYELYINARARGDARFIFKFEKNAPVQILPSNGPPIALTYNNGYPIPSGSNFTQFSNFWTAAGSGMADYSNAGFFTAGNNLGGSNYNSPSAASITGSVSVPPTAWDGTPLSGASLAIKEGAVAEPPWTLLPPATNVPLTTFSVWDQFMLKQGSQPTYTLNRVNYDAMAGLLIPRAVAYSAGLINFLFRGQMAISLPHEGVYGIVDHSSLYNNSRNTDPLSRTQGFSKIKLQLAIVEKSYLPGRRSADCHKISIV
jgi:hypothetical protein